MNYILTLTEQDVLVLSEALGNMSFKQVSTLIAKLQQQINEQQSAQKKEN